MKDTVVTIVNYEKYKGRKDVENNSWFRMSNRFLEDSDFFEFSHEEKLVWIYLLSLASQKNSARIHVSHQHAHQVCNISAKSINSSIEKLCKLGILKRERTRTLRGRYVDDTSTCSTDRQTDITNKTNITPEAFDFAEIYSLYPRKEGKSDGLKICKREIKTKADFELLRSAVIRYREHCESAGTDKKFIKHFDSFMGRWRDSLDPDYGTSDLRIVSNEADLSDIKWSGPDGVA